MPVKLESENILLYLEAETTHMHKFTNQSTPELDLDSLLPSSAFIFFFGAE